MANQIRFKQSELDRTRRSFSEEFKRQKVVEIDRKQTNISEVCKQYEVSATSVSRWIKKFLSII